MQSLVRQSANPHGLKSHIELQKAPILLKQCHPRRMDDVIETPKRVRSCLSKVQSLVPLQRQAPIQAKSQAQLSVYGRSDLIQRPHRAPLYLQSHSTATPLENLALPLSLLHRPAALHMH